MERLRGCAMLTRVSSMCFQARIPVHFLGRQCPQHLAWHSAGNKWKHSKSYTELGAWVSLKGHVLLG